MTNWTTLKASQLLPTTLVSSIKNFAKLLDGALSDLENAASIDVKIPSVPSLPNPTTTVVNALLDTLDDMLSSGRIHVLVIPIAKTPPRPAASAVPPTLQDLKDMTGIDLGPTTTAQADAYASMVEKSGGNAGFYAAFAESLMDLRDPNRPQYDVGEDAVTMATLLVGAPSLASALSAATTLETLIRPKGSATSMTARVVPTPQGLSAKPVSAPSGQGVGVRLTWEPPIDAYQARYFPGVVITVKRYAVIRSTDAKMQTARSVLDLFPTQALTQGMTAGEHKVVTIGSGRNAAYLDTGADLEKPAYYAIAWECEVREAGQIATLPFDRLSSVMKVVPRAPTPPQTGTAPDWIATSSAIGMFPAVEAAAKRLIEQARVLLAPSSDPTKRLKDAVTLVTDVSAALSARSSELMADMERLAAALARPLPSLHVTRMTSATGGNTYLLAELANRLGDVTDPSRPPFDHGEYVCGVCIVAGAARLADIAGIVSLLDSLFGPATPDNPLLGVLEAIDTLVAQAESDVFGPSMTPVPGTTTDPITGITTQAVDPVTGRAPVPSRPAIANDGTAVTGTDPKNPAAGETNVKTPADFC